MWAVANAVGPVTLDEARDKIAELKASIAFQNKQILRWHRMAAEYQEWVDFYHAGEGDYADFLRKRLAPKDGVGETRYQVPCTGVNHDQPPPSREKGEGEK
jgi:hypothetical protein